jgi:hypothetical protein
MRHPCSRKGKFRSFFAGLEGRGVRSRPALLEELKQEIFARLLAPSCYAWPDNDYNGQNHFD